MDETKGKWRERWIWGGSQAPLTNNIEHESDGNKGGVRWTAD